MKRTLAWIGILAIVLAFVALIFCVATGAPANTIMAILFCMTIIPVIIYGMLLILKLNKPDGKKDETE